jgi:thiosulfate dehydrogenase
MRNVIMVLGVGLGLVFGEPALRPVLTVQAAPSEATQPSGFDVDKLPDSSWGKAVRLGRNLARSTHSLIGPDAQDPAKRYAGNGLDCASCHLEAGTRASALPFIGVFKAYPQYRPREGRIETLEDRINGCMMRSQNGKPLPVDSEEMKALIAYFEFLSTEQPAGMPVASRDAGRMPELTRAANSTAGAETFANVCARCHGADGQGRRAEGGDGYTYPPLWGPDSFNDGAGMARLIQAANFIRSNMPFDKTREQPVLTPEQAWDVAAYIESRARPTMTGLDRDYPVRSERPVDAPYGPYVDGFPPDQHKFGPFEPIRSKLKAVNGE